MVKNISLFDLDHTLLSVNCSFSFGSYLYKKRIFSTFLMVKLVVLYAMHKLGWLSLTKLHTEIFKQLFFGKEATVFKAYIQSFIDEQLHKILYNPAIARLNEAKKNQHFISILSNSPDFIVGPIAAYLGVTDYQATVYEVDAEGKFSYISCFFQGVDKADYIKKLKKSFNLEKINVIAYSDSFLDLPFLQEADLRITVNPDRTLKSIAIKNSWEVI